MFIYTEQTPNPETLKFLPGVTVMGTDSAVEFKDSEAAFQASPLAGTLLELDGVAGVFFGSDFISVTKETDQEWYVIKPSVLGVMMEHFTTERPLFIDQSSAHTKPENAPQYAEEDAEIVEKIEQLLETKVRPAVSQDGGDIVFHGFERGVVYLAMRGACAGCPSSTATLKMGIENLLKHYIPEVTEVRPSTI